MPQVDNYDKYINADKRTTRPIFPMVKEYWLARCQDHLPPDLIAGKTVLDLGCFTGLTGQYLLDNGAAHYTGVEVNKVFADQAKTFLSDYITDQKANIIQEDIRTFLDTNTTMYDMVICTGVLFCFIDPVSILIKMANFADKTLFLISTHPLQSFAKALGVYYPPNTQMTAGDGSQRTIGLAGIISLPLVNRTLRDSGFNRRATKYKTIGPDSTLYEDDYPTLAPNATSRFVVSYDRSTRNILPLLEDNVIKGMNVSNLGIYLPNESNGQTGQPSITGTTADPALATGPTGPDGTP